MKTIYRIMPALFALFLLTTPLLLSSHGQVPLSHSRDQVSTSDREQPDSTSTVASRVEKAQPTTDAAKSTADKATEPSVKIGSRSDDPKFKTLGCGLFCRKCIEAGGSCVPTPYGCFCE